MDLSILKKIGLNDKEIKVYTKLLEYNSISVRSLAELTGINRGTTYDILKKLQEDGLVSYFHQETKQKFVAEPPEKLIDRLKEKEEDIKNTKNKINDLIPELKSLQGKSGSGPITKFYEGKSGIKTILNDVLDSLDKGEEYYVYSAKDSSQDINSAYPDYTKKRIKLGIKVKSISLAEGGSTHGLDERKWLGSNDKSATFIIIYKHKCAFISRDERNNPIGVIIENEMIYKTQEMIFKKLWKLL